MICARLSTVVPALLASPPATETKASEPAPPPIMPESKEAPLMASGDVGSMIAAMLLEAGAHARETARRARDAAFQAEEAAESQKISDMKSEASDRMWGGLAEAAGGMASGAGQISAGTFQHVDPKLFDGSGTATKAVGQGASAFWNRSADDEKRDGVDADRKITQSKRDIDRASDDDKDARDLMRRAIEHYKDFVTAKDEAKRAALFRA